MYKRQRDRLFAESYKELKRLARSRLRLGARNTVLNTTALVHDAYLRLVRVGDLRVDDRHEFFAYAACVMRSVIVDSARARLAERRGGGGIKCTLPTEGPEDLAQDEAGVLQVHEALEVLAQADARLAAVVEMRYFGGYSESEIAEALNVTERTVGRDWNKARVLLQAILQEA